MIGVGDDDVQYRHTGLGRGWGLDARHTKKLSGFVLEGQISPKREMLPSD